MTLEQIFTTVDKVMAAYAPLPGDRKIYRVDVRHVDVLGAKGDGDGWVLSHYYVHDAISPQHAIVEAKKRSVFAHIAGIEFTAEETNER